MTAQYYRNRIDPIYSAQNTGARSLRRIATVVDTWRNEGMVGEHTTFECVDLAGTPAAVVAQTGRKTRLFTLGDWLSLGADRLLRVSPGTRPPGSQRVQAIQHRGRTSLEELDALLMGWVARRAIDPRTALTRTEYRHQPAALVTDARRRGQLLVLTDWLVRPIGEDHLYVLPADRFAARFVLLNTPPAPHAADATPPKRDVNMHIDKFPPQHHA